MSGQSSSVQRRVEGGERRQRNLGGGETERGGVRHFPISEIILSFLLASIYFECGSNKKIGFDSIF